MAPKKDGRPGAVGTPAPPASEAVYTCEELGQRLGVHARTIVDHIRAKELKAHKRFRQWFIMHTDLVSFLRNGPSNL